MNVRVLFFSVLQDITGTAETNVSLEEENPTVGTLLDYLFKTWPGLSDWAPSILIAVDQVYARRPDALHADAEVAIMPPVQGG
jgi:molybdopterin synthase sulfur carrier subunit